MGGRSIDWADMYRDWLRLWNLTEPRFFYDPQNLEAFILDSVQVVQHNPLVAAILQAIRTDCVIMPRDGVGKTSLEIYGQIVQAIREQQIERAEAARHAGNDWESVLRDGFEPSAAKVIQILCVFCSHLGRQFRIETDCFCGNHSSDPQHRTFESGYRFDPQLFEVLRQGIYDHAEEKNGCEKTSSQAIHEIDDQASTC